MGEGCEGETCCCCGEETNILIVFIRARGGDQKTKRKEEEDMMTSSSRFCACKGVCSRMEMGPTKRSGWYLRVRARQLGSKLVGNAPDAAAVVQIQTTCFLRASSLAQDNALYTIETWACPGWGAGIACVGRKTNRFDASVARSIMLKCIALPHRSRRHRTPGSISMLSEQPVLFLAQPQSHF